ncbi:Uncharacterised protein [uncultured archaeon]|nr:Uncharacterised protein [uncultured archaeon]
MEEVDVAESLKTLSARIDELSDALFGKHGSISTAFTEGKTRAEDTIKERPLACLGGAFIGGLVLGYLISRKS